ncbi:ATP-binding protein, partial [bacterium]|nr:ATP-binding protein [bacterium]
MDKIRIKNLRSLKDTNYIDLKPITLLVGRNSSGKSTFLRTFPLFKQTVEARTKSPILFYSRNGVDFGSYEDIKPSFSTKDDCLEFEFVLDKIALYTNARNPLHSITNLSTTLKIAADSKNKPTLVCLKLEFSDNSIEIHINNKLNEISTFRVNGEEILTEDKFVSFTRNFLPDRIYQKQGDSLVRLEEFSRGKLIEAVKESLTSSSSSSLALRIIKHISVIANKDVFLEKILSFKDSKTWTKRTKNLTTSCKYFTKLYNLTLIKFLEELLSISNINLRDTFLQIKYIAPIRATAERYYRVQDLDTDEIDPYGQNLPMFLASLPKNTMEKFQEWTKENFDFQVKIKKVEGHYSIKVFYEDKFEVNISDMGFGYSQILPIITQIWYSSKYPNRRTFYRSKNTPTIFVIEQPELHLHPDFQAKFADAIVSIIHSLGDKSHHVKLIIETHSKVIINRIGQNISRGRFSEENVNVVIFNKEHDSAATDVTISTYKENGLLKDWPVGFFSP